ncbi:MAG TPA: hypothetical protein VF651_06295 [Gammaproteobacteria bacterium]
MRQGVHPSYNFEALLTRTKPQPGELGRAKINAVAVRNRLALEFRIRRAMAIGSQVRGTAVRYYSDADYMYIFSRDDTRWGRATINSTTLLDNVRSLLIGRYPNTEIGRDGQAIVIGFAQGQRSMDIVPGWFDGFESRRPIYKIPDGAGEWIRTSPELHDSLFKTADLQARGKLSRTIRLLKWWKYSRATPLPISSFYAELVLSSLGTCVGVKSYSTCMYDSLLALHQRNGRALQDPAGISGLIPMASTQAKLQQAREAIASALDRAARACDAERVRNHLEANYQWNLLFNGEF